MFTESIFIPFAEGELLHVKRFYVDANAPALLLIPGSIENGHIFYSKSGKGFAPWMAERGFDVFVADLRGRGQSTPKISRESKFGQAEALSDEYPAYFAKIKEIKGTNKVFVATHSWAGVNVLAFLARHEMDLEVPAAVFFGAKRHISVRPFPRYWLMISLAWNLLAKRSIRKHGFLHALHYRMGSDSISARDHAETDAWVRAGQEWKHWHDGFDYREAFRKMKLPPILYLAGKKDHVLGHPKDVALLAEETGAHQNKKVLVLSKANGYLHDYGHIDMLTHPDAPRDHFPAVLQWFKQHGALE
ncbi:MAG: alpha/beta fold hydrolase [Bacteroidetes bacterium]|nr:alpha/beta fold hydrolase [Bacteroidota bacterium]